MKNPKHKIIFEGPELAGKSYLMSEVYKHIEPRYNSGGHILDGCHWLNLDVGLYGTPLGGAAINNYINLFEDLESANVMAEKFHITEAVYQKLYHDKDFDFSSIDDRLAKLNTRIVLTIFDEDEKLLEHRLKDRLNLYPHYKKIAQAPSAYIKQQRLYLDLIKKSKLDYLIINSSKLPNPGLVEQILHFLREK